MKLRYIIFSMLAAAMCYAGSTTDGDQDSSLTVAEDERLTNAAQLPDSQTFTGDTNTFTGSVAISGQLEVAGTNIWAAMSSSGQQYYDRGDPAAWDYEPGDFTTDNTYRDLDLSGISVVGTNRALVYMRFAFKGTVGATIRLRQNGNINDFNTYRGQFRTVGDTVHDYPWVYTDENGVIEYKISNSSWTNLNMLIMGAIR